MGIADLPPIAKRILAARGKKEEEIETFLLSRLSDLSDPFLLPDMEKATERAMRAIRSQEKVGLFADYDADGITSAALVFRFLRRLSLAPVVYIPKRSEGYGLSRRAIEVFRKEGVSLLLCLDCGSTNEEEIAFAKENGLDTIVIDHHEITSPPSGAEACVNPKRQDSSFPTRELASAGVTFFFLMALRRKLTEAGIIKEKVNLRTELDLVAVGTYADMVPLEKDNRILVRHGLQVMRERPREWLNVTKRMGVVGTTIDEWTMNFLIVPRINAPGRIEDPMSSFIYVTSEDRSEIEKAFAHLCMCNAERQRMEEETLREAVEMIEREGLLARRFLVLHKRGWPLGVLGLVAQRLAETYKRPCIVLSEQDGLWKGSGRGVEGFDLYGTLSCLSHLFSRFGGHKYACGLTLEEGSLARLKDEVEGLLEGFETVRREAVIDAEAEFEELTAGFAEFMELLSPFGVGNPRPSLLLRPKRLELKDGEHVKIIDRKNVTWDGILRTQPKQTFRAIIASPQVVERGGASFVHLLVTEFLE
jgi:single-stranded-DNA-specific exonuclease